ncbi:MAG: hypothetical protein KKB35_01890, partial [Proteobacteria bacterium]|nr:hypothetical protein [Pseudomonadota bacterium]
METNASACLKFFQKCLKTPKNGCLDHRSSPEQYQKETEGYLNKTLANPDNRVSARGVLPSSYYRQKRFLRKEAN